DAYVRCLTRRRARGFVQVLLRRRLEPRKTPAAAEEVFLALMRVAVRRIGANAHAADGIDGLAIRGARLVAGRVMGMFVHWHSNASLIERAERPDGPDPGSSARRTSVRTSVRKACRASTRAHPTVRHS